MTNILYKILYLNIFTLFLFPKVNLSQVNYETMQTALIYQFIQNIDWDNEKNIDGYVIGILSSNDNIYNALSAATKTKKIKGKKVELELIKNINNLPDINVLYTDKYYSEKIERIWNNIEHRNILLISDNCEDEKYIMLNIIYNEQTQAVSFQINKANLIIENFKINPQLMLLGGTEVDIRNLYKQMKISLDIKGIELAKKDSMIFNLNNEITERKNESEKLLDNIKLLSERVNERELNLTLLSDKSKAQNNVLAEQKKENNELQKTIHNQQNILQNKEKAISKRTEKLDSLLSESTYLQEIIGNQKNILLEKENRIRTQKKLNIYTIILVVVLIALGISFISAFLIKRKSNNELSFINERLEEQKAEVEATLQQLTETQSQLVQAEKMASLGILTAGIAHEINNPINYISSSISGLKSILNQVIDLSNLNKLKPVIDQEYNIEKKEELEYLLNGINKLMTNIETGVYKTTEIIKSLRSFSRLDNDELIQTNIHTQIDSTLTLLHNQYKNRIKIIKNYGELPEIKCYPGKINQVFMNILNNAIQAISEKGTITITTSTDYYKTDNSQKYVKILIKDNGAGIEKELLDKITDPFFTTKDVGKGTGLGLSISHEFIEQHKGKLKYKSTINKGSSFYIYLPIL